MKAKMKFTRWKLEDDLTSEELLYAYIAEVIKENDPVALSEAIDDVNRILKNLLKKTEKKGDINYNIDIRTFFRQLAQIRPMLKTAS